MCNCGSEKRLQAVGVLECLITWLTDKSQIQRNTFLRCQGLKECCRFKFIGEIAKKSKDCEAGISTQMQVN